MHAEVVEVSPICFFLPGRASQDFALLQTLGEASDEVNAVSWRGQVLAAAGNDKKLRIYHEALGLGLGCLTWRLGVGCGGARFF